MPTRTGCHRPKITAASAMNPRPDVMLSVNWCWSSARYTPPNEATTLWMVEQAREMAGSRGVEITVLDEKEIAEKGTAFFTDLVDDVKTVKNLIEVAFGLADDVEKWAKEQADREITDYNESVEG